MSEIAFNVDNNKQLAFLKKISEIDKNLYQPGIERKFTKPEHKKKFNNYRGQWTIYVNTVRNNIGTILINKLEQNEKGFEDGIKAINQEIQEINHTGGFLEILGRTIDILDNIVRLVI
ncbi:MAG: hypothetical protein RMY64_07695 [Nostoc sp. DedQUE08]|uniref:hypothetical protein n=1 Tax=Nostoc sp. DedQUE08 TaxID=3075393 RepID=UPI002AD4CDFC|nr:hypothetical protein [Nostoc sp. DedQUE08]MDZ8065510.1 hypothetical protein [Nostoc sp. DedQUE08]